MNNNEIEQAQNNAQQVVIVKKKSSKGLVIVASLFAVIAIGLGVCLAIMMINQSKNSGDGDKGDNGTTATEGAGTDNGGSDEQKVDIAKKIQELIDDINTEYSSVIGASYAAKKTENNGVQISVADGVLMKTNRSYGLEANYAGDDAFYELIASKRLALNDALVKAFSKHDLKKTAAPTGFMTWGADTNEFAFFSDNNITCFYSTIYGFGVDCADKNWYSQEDKDLIIALGKAYETAEGDKIGFIDTKASDIKKVGSNEYERIDAFVEDAAALFYRKVGGEWKFFKLAQSAFTCDTFNTDELKKVYAGEPCYDGEKDSVVK